MNHLINIQNKDGQLVVSSRQVAEHFDKQHKDVLESIRSIQGQISTAEFSALFILSSYKAANGKNNPEYLLTRDGFTLLAMGFTGPKALEWKLKYIEAFNKMEQLKNNLLVTTNLSPELQVLINLELKQKELETAVSETQKEIQNMRDIIKLDTTSWRKDTSDLINKMALKLGGFEYIKTIREESYKLLNDRMGVALEIRLTNKRRRMADEGISKSRRDKLNYLDIIAEDKKLVEGYVAIIKEMAIKYGVA
jgi:Rha family phage regulatory protein